jgi:hypothetical protein
MVVRQTLVVAVKESVRTEKEDSKRRGRRKEKRKKKEEKEERENGCNTFCVMLTKGCKNCCIGEAGPPDCCVPCMV